MCRSSLLSLFLSLQRYILLGTQRAESLGFGGGGGRKIKGHRSHDSLWIWDRRCGSSYSLPSFWSWLGSRKRPEVCNGSLTPIPSLPYFPVNTDAAFGKMLPPAPFELTRTCRRRRCTWMQQVPSAAPRNAQKTLPLFRGSPRTGQSRSWRSGRYPHARVCQAMPGVEGTVQSSSLRMEPGSF